jgi:IPT/TIG domain
MSENHLTRRSRRIAALLLMLALCAPLLPARAALRDNEGQVIVTRAEVDFGTNRITIMGKNFGTVTPTVRLEYETLVVVSSSPTQIVAVLPAVVPAGTYLLTIRRPKKGKVDSNAKCKEDDDCQTVDITIGAVGPSQPDGATGGAEGATKQRP